MAITLKRWSHRTVQTATAKPDSGFHRQWAGHKERANQQLTSFFSARTDLQAARLMQAVEYSVQNGGKRFRAMLVYASGACFGAPVEALDNAAISLELMHAYSLIHDDLPAMDDDELRRGQPSCHIHFDQATAILAGDALQSLAFEALSRKNSYLSVAQQLKMVQRLARASGPQGMAGGQSLDMIATGRRLDQDALQTIHEGKTGALIRCALALGALASPEIEQQELQILDQYGRDIGLAFQVVDDILDLTQNSETLGKQSGADTAQHKNTYPALMGLPAARDYAQQLVHSAGQSLGKLSRDTDFLLQLADFTLSRDH